MRYGTEGNQYGLWLYGHEDYNINNLWAIDVDWDGDGAYDGYNEAMRCTDIQIRRGRKTAVGAIGAGFQYSDVGEARITLDNYNGDYDPYNTNAPHYPNVKPGKYIRISVKHGHEGDREYLFAGIISDISISDHGNSNKQATISCKDGWNFLNNKVVNIPVQTNISVGDAIALILTEAGWPSIWGSSLDKGIAILPYFWVNNKTAAQAINELNDAEFGTVVILGTGQFVFRARGEKPATSLSLTQSDILKQIKVPNPWSVTRNNVEMVVYPRSVVSGVKFYTMGDTPLLAPGDSLIVWGDCNYNGFPAAISVIDSVGFTANTTETGTGVDLTASFGMNSEAYGERIKLTITNNHATSSGYVRSAIATGDLIICQNQSSVFVDNSSGLESKTFKVNSHWITDINNAENYASFLLNYLEDDTPFPIIKVQGHNDWQFDIDLFDVISLDIDRLDIDTQNFRIAFLEHNWESETGQLVTTTIYTEKNLPAGTADVNLMTNGSFETGDLTGWTTSGTVFSVISDGIYEGSYCLQVSEPTAASTLTTGRMLCDEQSTYHFSCYTKEVVLASSYTSVDCAVTEIAYVDSLDDTAHQGSVIVGGKQSRAYRTYLKVEMGTANIPSGADVTAAILTLEQTAHTSQLNTDINVHRIIGTWADSTVKWSTKPAYENQAIGTITLGINEPNGLKEIELSDRYIEEMIASGTWTNNGFALIGAPEGGIVETQKTVYWWERYITGYVTRTYGPGETITVPVYGYRLKSKVVTGYATYDNYYTFSNNPYLRVTYDTVINHYADYVINVKWYNGAVTGTLISTSTLATENGEIDWNLRDLQLNSPKNAESFEIVITANPSGCKFYVDKIEAKKIGFY